MNFWRESDVEGLFKERVIVHWFCCWYLLLGRVLESCSISKSFWIIEGCESLERKRGVRWCLCLLSVWQLLWNVFGFRVHTDGGNSIIWILYTVWLKKNKKFRETSLRWGKRAVVSVPRKMVNSWVLNLLLTDRRFVFKIFSFLIFWTYKYLIFGHFVKLPNTKKQNI